MKMSWLFFPLLFFLSCNLVFGQGMPVLDWAEYIETDTSNFDNNLSGDDDTVQKALDKLDDMSSGGSISDDAYGASWDGDTTTGASRNAIYDKIETLAGGHDAVTLDANADTLLSLSGQELGLDTQTANYIFSGPSSGAPAVPSFRALADDDIPNAITVTPINATTESAIEAVVDLQDLQGAVTDSQVPDDITITETDPNALLTAGTDNVKDTHIDWGSGAGQVDSDDIPEGSTNYFDDDGVDDDVPEAGDYTNLTGGTAITNSPTGTINVDIAAITDGDTTHVPSSDGVYDFCETTQDYLKTSENNDSADDVTDDNVESMATAGVSGTSPISDGAGALAMTDVLTEAELDTEAELEAQITDMANIIQATEIDTEAEFEAICASLNFIISTEIDTSAELAAIIGDETGSGAAVFAASPTLVTPTLGAATATTLDTGQGAHELYAMDQDVQTTDAVTFATVDTGNGAYELQDASDIAKGMVELATSAETTTGTDAARAVTPDGIAGSDYGKRVIQLKLTNEDTALSTGDGAIIFVVSSELNGYNLVDADAAVTTVSSSGTPTYQVRNVTDSVDMLSTSITVDASEYTSYTAATPPVIDTTHDDVATGDLIAIDKDVAGTGEKGDIVVLTFQKP